MPFFCSISYPQNWEQSLHHKNSFEQKLFARQVAGLMKISKDCSSFDFIGEVWVNQIAMYKVILCFRWQSKWTVSSGGHSKGFYTVFRSSSRWKIQYVHYIWLILKCYLLILMQIFDFSRRFFSKMLIGFTLSSLDLLVLWISSGAHLKGLNPVIVFVY